MMKKAKRCRHEFAYVRPNPKADEPGEWLWEPCSWDESPDGGDFQFCFKCGTEAHYNG